MRQQRGLGLLGELVRRPQRGAREEGEQRAGEPRQVLAPLAQRRHHQLDDVEAEEQVLAEAAGLHLGVEVAVGGGDHPHVGDAGPVLADALEPLLLEEAQQPCLEAGRELADLIEEERAALGGLDPAGLVADRAGEGAAGVAEQLAGQQLLGERGAVDGDERPRAPRREPVEQPRQHPLAGAALAPQQHRHVVARGPAHHVQRGLHRRRRGRQLGLGHRVGEPPLQLGEAALQLAPAAVALDRGLDLRGRERLGEVVLGAAPDRLDRGLEGCVGGDEDQLQARPLLEEPRDQVEPTLLAEAQVEEREVGGNSPELVERALAAAGLGDGAAECLEKRTQRGADVFLVIDDQDPHGHDGFFWSRGHHGAPHSTTETRTTPAASPPAQSAAGWSLAPRPDRRAARPRSLAG